MQNILNALKKIDRIVLRALKALTTMVFVLLSILVSAGVLVRFVPVASMHWFDEIIELLYAHLIFYGAAALWITREHFSVGDWIGPMILKGSRIRCFHRAAVEVLVLIFTGVFFYYSLQLTLLAQDVTNVFAIPKRVLYSCMPIAGSVMIIYSIRNVIVEMVGMIKSGQEKGNPT